MASASSVRAGEAYVELAARSQRLNQELKKGLDKVRSFADQATTLARINLSIIVPAVSPLVRVTNEYSKFDDKMRVVQATTKATGKDFQDLTKLARDLGATTSFTAQQVAEGMVALGRSGFSASEIKVITRSMLDLARATATDLAQSIEIASSVLRGFSLDASQATRVADVLSASANGSAQTLEDLGYSFKFVTPLAREVGLSLEDTAKATAFLANMGLKGTLAATALRNILIRLSDSNIQALYRQNGVEVLDQQTGAVRNLLEILKDLAAQTKTMPSGARLGLFRELFGLYGLAGGASLASGIDMSRVFDNIDKASGQAEQVAKQMDAGIGGAIRIAWSELSDAFLEVGKVLSAPIKEALFLTKNYSQIIKDFVNDNKQAIEGIIKLISSIAELTANITAFVGQTALSHPAITELVVAFLALSPLIYGVGVTLKALVGIFTAFRVVSLAVAMGQKKLFRGVSGLNFANRQLAAAASLASNASKEEANALTLSNSAVAKHSSLLAEAQVKATNYQNAVKQLQAAQTTQLQAEQAAVAATSKVNTAQANATNALNRRTNAENALKQAILNKNNIQTQTRAQTQAQVQAAQATVTQAKAALQAERAAYAQAKADLKAAQAVERKALSQFKAAQSAVQSTDTAKQKAYADLQAANAATQQAAADEQAAKAALTKAKANSQAAYATRQLALVQKQNAMSDQKSMVAFAGVAAVYGAVTSAAFAYSRAVERQDELTRRRIENADKEADSLERKQQADIELLNKLKELSDVQNKTNDEISEAKRIIDLLNKSYYGLGLTIDETTGKIEGLSDAQNELTRQFAEQKKIAIQRQIDAMTAALQRNQEKRNKLTDKGFLSWGRSYLTSFNAMWNGGKSVQDIIEDSFQEDRDLRARIASLQVEKDVLEARTEKKEAEKSEYDKLVSSARAAESTVAEKLEKMFGKQELEIPPNQLFEDFNVAIKSWLKNNIDALQIQLKENKITKEDFDAQVAEWERTADNKIERATAWVDKENRKAAQSLAESPLQQRIAQANQALADAYEKANPLMIENAQKEVDLAKKEANDLTLKNARANSDAARKAFENATKAYEAAKAANNTLPDVLNQLYNNFVMAQNEMNTANNDLASAIQNVARDVEQSKLDYHVVGSFNASEAWDNIGQTTMIQLEQQQRELLNKLDNKVWKIISYMSADLAGEYV